MKKTICLWALLLIVVSCTNDDNYNDEHGDKAVIPPKGRIIRIMTYNIYGARATSPANAADLDALAEVIRRQDPDFVTLNEVDVFTNRTVFFVSYITLIFIYAVLIFLKLYFLQTEGSVQR